MGAIKQFYIGKAEELEKQIRECDEVFELESIVSEFVWAYENNWLDEDWLPNGYETTLFDLAFYCIVTGATLDSMLIEKFLSDNNMPIIGLYGVNKGRRAG